MPEDNNPNEGDSLVFYRLGQIEKDVEEINRDKQETWRAIGRLSSDVEGMAQASKAFQESVIRQFTQVDQKINEEKEDRKEDIERERETVTKLRSAARELLLLIAGGTVTFIGALILKILGTG